jgi:hypothetical protein
MRSRTTAKSRQTMTDLTQFSVMAALIISGLGLFAFMFQRLESRLDHRIDRLEDRVIGIETEMRDGFTSLRHDLAEEFRAQRAEAAAQITAITASRKE